MTSTAEKAYQHIGATPGCADHDHDLVHELSKKLDAVWHYDQYIANAENHPHVQEMWRDFKRQSEADVQRLKRLIAEEIQRGCF
jgi:hypothetical protein